MSRWSVVGGRWVGGGPVGESVEHLLVDRWSVVGGPWVGGGHAGRLLVVDVLSVVGGFVIRRFCPQ